jgi:glycerate 2-kinase
VIELLRQHVLATIRALRNHVAAAIPPALADAVAHAGRGGDVLLLAFGKAARPMAEAALACLPHDRVRGLCAVPAPDDAPLPPLEVFAAGHPLPTAASFAAGARALALCRAATAKDHVVFLVSGGGSALLEAPIVEGLSLEDFVACHRALVASGAAIGTMNAIRRRLSAVKGGRLAAAAAGASARTTLVVSDVRGPAADVASGPSLPAPASQPATTTGPLAGRLARLGLGERLAHRDLPPLPAVPDDPVHVLLDEFAARRDLGQRLRRDGFVVADDPDADDWPVEAAARHLLRRLERLRRRHPGRRVAVVTSGELSVPLPPEPGTGGRNQQFVLACARLVRGRRIAVLSAGTDGVDGNSPAAGAAADGHTLTRARRLGLDAHDHLRRFDAFPLFSALGTALVTGATATNVRDLRVLAADC